MFSCPLINSQTLVSSLTGWWWYELVYHLPSLLPSLSHHIFSTQLRLFFMCRHSRPSCGQLPEELLIEFNDLMNLVDFFILSTTHLVSLNFSSHFWPGYNWQNVGCESAVNTNWVTSWECFNAMVHEYQVNPRLNWHHLAPLNHELNWLDLVA